MLPNIKVGKSRKKALSHLHAINADGYRDGIAAGTQRGKATTAPTTPQNRKLLDSGSTASEKAKPFIATNAQQSVAPMRRITRNHQRISAI